MPLSTHTGAPVAPLDEADVLRLAARAALAWLREGDALSAVSVLQTALDGAAPDPLHDLYRAFWAYDGDGDLAPLLAAWGRVKEARDEQ